MWARLFWQGVRPKQKYHMVDWATVCKPREFGGLGVLNTKVMNIALLLKWIWKIYQDADGLWVDLLRANTWGIMTSFLRRSSQRAPSSGTHYKKSNGTLNWEINIGCATAGAPISGWTSGRDRGPSATAFRGYLAAARTLSVRSQGWDTWMGGALGWRTFGPSETVEWDNLCRVFDLCTFSTEKDEVSWALEPSGGHSTSSMYMRLSQGAAVTHFKDVWLMPSWWPARWEPQEEGVMNIAARYSLS
jgi:hypothetical protein